MKHQNSIIFYLVILFSIFFAHPVSSQDQAGKEPSLTDLLSNKIGTEWKATGGAQKFDSGQLSTNPEIKLLLEYGLQSLASRQYTNGKDKLAVEAYEMKYASGAYGLWTFHRSSLAAEQKEFFSGRLLVRLSATNSGILEAVATELQSQLPPTTDPPLLPTYLPDQNKILASEKYLVGPEAISQIPVLSDLKDAIDFTGGTHAAMAEYKNGEGKMAIILVEFQSPQFATEGLAKIQQHFNSLSPEEQKKRLLRRVGNYAVEAVNVADTKAAEELLKQIKYMARVHWEGKGMAAIPLQFRPPDPTSIREAVQTGQFIVAAFYWIGMLVLGAVFTGVFAGGAYFYWRRSQRRKAGMDVVFSDAGGMTRLNLDDYLLTEPRAAQKLLGKNE